MVTLAGDDLGVDVGVDDDDDDDEDAVVVAWESLLSLAFFFKPASSNKSTENELE